MKKKLIFFIILMIICFLIFIIIEFYVDVVGKKKIELGVFEVDVEIFINGKLVGKGFIVVIVFSNDCVIVIVRKVGFL